MQPAIIIINIRRLVRRIRKLRCHSYDVTTKDTKELKVPVEADSYIPRIVFTNNDDQLAVIDLEPSSECFQYVLCESEKRCFSFDPA